MRRMRMLDGNQVTRRGRSAGSKAPKAHGSYFRPYRDYMIRHRDIRPVLQSPQTYRSSPRLTLCWPSSGVSCHRLLGADVLFPEERPAVPPDWSARNVSGTQSCLNRAPTQRRIFAQGRFNFSTGPRRRVETKCATVQRGRWRSWSMFRGGQIVDCCCFVSSRTLLPRPAPRAASAIAQVRGDSAFPRASFPLAHRVVQDGILQRSPSGAWAAIPRA